MKKVLTFLKDFWAIHLFTILSLACGSNIAFDTDIGILLRVLGLCIIFLGGVLEGVTIGICLD